MLSTINFNITSGHIIKQNIPANVAIISSNIPIILKLNYLVLWWTLLILVGATLITVLTLGWTTFKLPKVKPYSVPLFAVNQYVPASVNTKLLKYAMPLTTCTLRVVKLLLPLALIK
jgi:hypothetical protein